MAKTKIKIIVDDKEKEIDFDTIKVLDKLKKRMCNLDEIQKILIYLFK